MAVRVNENIRLDILTRDLMGTEKNGSVEALLTANPGLADQGAYIDENTLIHVPPRLAKPASPTILPWD